MDNFHINAILKGIGSNLSCKGCKAKIALDKIKLISQSNEMANFQVICPNCEAVMKISAEVNKVEKSPVKNKRIQVKSNPNKQWKVDVKDTIIKKEDLSVISKKLKGLSSFKGLFGIFLVIILFNFSGCENSAQTREDILGGIEQVKEKSSEIYEEGKQLTASASTLLEDAPEKFDKIKGDTENIIKDVKNAKAQADEKIKQAKEALEKAEKAQGAFSEALDSFYKFIGSEEEVGAGETIESGTGEAIENGTGKILQN